MMIVRFSGFASRLSSTHRELVTWLSRIQQGDFNQVNHEIEETIDTKIEEVLTFHDSEISKNRHLPQSFKKLFSVLYGSFQNILAKVSQENENIVMLLQLESSLLAKLTAVKVKIKFCSTVVDFLGMIEMECENYQSTVSAKCLRFTSRCFSASATSDLKLLYALTQEPTMAQREAICNMHNLTLDQVNNWFYVRRYRNRKMQQQQQQQQGDAKKRKFIMIQPVQPKQQQQIVPATNQYNVEVEDNSVESFENVFCNSITNFPFNEYSTPLFDPLFDVSIFTDCSAFLNADKFY